jgi:hypothetical protein
MRLAIPAATIGVMSIVVTAFAGDRPHRPAGRQGTPARASQQFARRHRYRPEVKRPPRQVRQTGTSLNFCAGRTSMPVRDGD